MGQKNTEIKICVGLKITNVNKKIPLIIEDYLTGTITYFTSKNNNIDFNKKPLLNEFGESIIENVIGGSYYTENGIIVPGKFWIYTENDRKYLLSIDNK